MQNEHNAKKYINAIQHDHSNNGTKVNGAKFMKCKKKFGNLNYYIIIKANKSSITKKIH